MNTKLTLSVDKEIIQNAKKFAKNNKTNLSRLVSNYLKLLMIKEKADIEISPWAKELRAGRPVNKTDKQLKAEYINYLDEKYK
jgi:hypothetical protein